MKVFSIGLPKTGTLCVCQAVNHLGIKNIHNPVDANTIGQLKLGEFKLQILEGYNGLFDLPSACFYRDYDRTFPGSKFILTTRKRQIRCNLASIWWNFVLRLTNLEGIARSERKSGGSMIFLHAQMFGCVNFDPHRFSRVYDEWHESILSYFAGRGDDLCLVPTGATNKWEFCAVFCKSQYLASHTLVFTSVDRSLLRRCRYVNKPAG